MYEHMNNTLSVIVSFTFITNLSNGSLQYANVHSADAFMRKKTEEIQLKTNLLYFFHIFIEIVVLFILQNSPSISPIFTLLSDVALPFFL